MNVLGLCIIGVCIWGLTLGVPAATGGHKHVHSKERVEDGAYIARDAHHHEGGEHHNEFDHEAILGSVKEAEEFDSLSPEEAKKRLGILVTKMDLNGDQYIDRHELGAWIIRSFRSLAEEDAAERFADADMNNDGKVTWAEYLAETYNIEDTEAVPKEPDNDESKLISEDKVMFDTADADKNGSLDSEEFIVFINPEEHPAMLPVILKQTLLSKDKNGDDKIDFQEFVGDRADHHDKEWLIVEKERFDNEVDKNHDGILDGSEILNWVVPSNEDIATDEVDHLFVSADEDHDDRLSYAEIVNNHEVFVGSEATDYGEHLQYLHMDDEL